MEVGYPAEATDEVVVVATGGLEYPGATLMTMVLLRLSATDGAAAAGAVTACGT